jgi:TATA-binding protein-associated factor Taf7
MFEVFDNGKSLGVTTKVDNVKDEEVFAATPEEALKDDRFSKGTFDLSKGPHKITIKATGPYEAGTAAIRVLDHDNVAFHKKNKHHHDGDDEDNDDDDNDDDDDDEDDDDEDDHKKKWNKDDDEDEDEKNKWEKKPTNEDIDLSHTVTYTKTKWVKAHHHKPTPY